MRPESWSIQEVAEWLSSIGLAEHLENFKRKFSPLYLYVNTKTYADLFMILIRGRISNGKNSIFALYLAYLLEIE